VVAPAVKFGLADAGVLDPQGPVAAAERLILLNATAIMLVVVVPVILMTFAFAWWFRASNARATYRPDWAYSGRIELVVWSIPAMVVILLAGVAWIGAHELDPSVMPHSAAKPLRIEVVALDWKWLFIYPGAQVAAVNQLTVPTGTPLEFVLTSATVMNAFFIPQLGSQIYTMPGMTTHLDLLAERAGDYPGLSSHFSGDGFADMRFMVHAVAPAEFERWLADARAERPALSRDAYAELAGASHNVAPRAYGAVDSGLFEQVIRTAAPPDRSASPRRDAAVQAD
jgi:cytochrome o ubiquinol oxidase subunit 2